MKLFTTPVSEHHISVPVYLNRRLTGDIVGILNIARIGGYVDPNSIKCGKDHVEYGFQPNRKGRELHLKATSCEKSKRIALEKAMSLIH